MQKSSLPRFPRFAAAVTLAAFATTSFAPLARAQEKAPAEADKAAAPAPKPAPAKPPDKKTRDAARKAYGDGEKAYAAGDYAGAIEGFSKANELIPSPHALYWIAKSLDGQGKTEDAIKAYETFLADGEHAKAGDDKVADATARLDALKATLVGEVNVDTVPMGATLSVDGTPQMGETPMILKLSPGTHKLTVSASGFETKEIDVEVKGGERLEQKIELTPKPAPPPEPEPVAEPAPAPAPPPPPPEKRSKVPAYVTLGIASAGAIVGTIFGIKALRSKSDFDSKPTGSAADKTERNALIADMAFGVAITLGVTGVVLLTSSDDAAPKAAKLHKLPPRAQLNVAPYVTTEGGGAAARLTF
jgi:outer membrane biosynthesis protein TonB